MLLRFRSSYVKGETIWEPGSEPIELKRWSIDEEEEAKKELAKCKCRYWEAFDSFYVEEYALEYCACDDEGEFLWGSDFDLAEDEKVAKAKEIVKLLQESDEQTPRLLAEFCYLAEMDSDWEYACDFEKELAEGLADEDDGESCEEVLLRAQNKLEVYL